MPAHPPSRIFLARPRPAISRDARANGALRDVTTSRRRVGTARPLDGDVVIDLTGTPPLSRHRPARRRRGWWLALAAVVVAMAVVAGANYVAAGRWRARAIVAQQRVEQAAADVAAQREAVVEARRATDVAQQRRRVAAEQLAVSEADVAALEARVYALAGDRARAQDYGDDALTPTPGALLRSLQAQVDSCVAQVDAMRVGLKDAAGADADVASWRRVLTAAQASCQQVAADVAALADATR